MAIQLHVNFEVGKASSKNKYVPSKIVRSFIYFLFLFYF